MSPNLAPRCHLRRFLRCHIIYHYLIFHLVLTPSVRTKSRKAQWEPARFENWKVCTKGQVFVHFGSSGRGKAAEMAQRTTSATPASTAISFQFRCQTEALGPSILPVEGLSRVESKTSNQSKFPGHAKHIGFFTLWGNSYKSHLHTNIYKLVYLEISKYCHGFQMVPGRQPSYGTLTTAVGIPLIS